MAKIAIFGIGQLGTVSAACLARDGHTVLAVDIDALRVDAVNAGRSPIVESGVGGLISDALMHGRLSATLDAEQAIERTQVSLVCVGTPSKADGSVSLANIVKTCGVIGRAIAKSGAQHCVIIRSPLVPGTMETVCIPVLEAASGLRAGVDFGVGYYPAFLCEGTALKDYDNPALIVFGALDTLTFAMLNLLTKDIPCDTHEVDLRTAEMVKFAVGNTNDEAEGWLRDALSHHPMVNLTRVQPRLVASGAVQGAFG